MKIITILFLLLNSWFLSAQTSIYHSFPDSNAVWNYKLQANCFANGSANEDYSIVIAGDTILNNTTYNKLYTPFVVSFSTGTCGGILNGYKGAIRHDLIGKKVYIIPSQDTTEQLLYDFTLQVGDTVTGYTQLFPFQPDTVISIDSMLIGSLFRKRWIINTCYNISIIEGIGSTYGFFEKSPGCITDFPDFSLNCFQQNSQTMYPNSTSNCQIITSINTIPIVEENINIYPNPSNGSLTIDFRTIQIKEIRLINLLGKIIHSQELRKEKSIDINNLPQGYFFLIMIDQYNQTISKKIVVTN
ncbi:MAG: hypothetical protein ACJASF_002437 [Vicingaceae bacterium]|jgi:hypothetical protein